MDYLASTQTLEKNATGCLVIPVFEDQKLSDDAKSLDKLTDGILRDIVKRGDMGGSVGQTLLLHDLPGIASERVLLVGCGKMDALNEKNFRSAIIAMMGALKTTGSKDATCYLTRLPLKKRDLNWKIRYAIECIEHDDYAFTEFKSEKSNTKPKLKKTAFPATNKSDADSAKSAIKAGKALAEGIKLTRDLGHMPGNVCTPAHLAKIGRELGKQYTKVKTTVLEASDMKKLGMGSFLSVAQGSPNPPKLVAVHYKGTSKDKNPVVLVGKGITFDTGGNSLKPAASMIGMKFDMLGAASVLGVIKACAEMSLPVNVVGLLACAENTPGGPASRPDDIVTSMSGKTIEILNTDAEGRLVLCDTLTYAKKYKPDTVIDMATLTGACIVAIGHHATAVYANHQPLADALLAAGETALDRGWQMPLWEEYTEQLKSNVADLANIGGPAAGSVTAACFLAEFAKDLQWAHLDIAGSCGHMTGSDRGPSGRPVPMLMQYLMARVEKRDGKS